MADDSAPETEARFREVLAHLPEVVACARRRRECAEDFALCAALWIDAPLNDDADGAQALPTSGLNPKED